MELEKKVPGSELPAPASPMLPRAVSEEERSEMWVSAGSVPRLLALTRQEGASTERPKAPSIWGAHGRVLGLLLLCQQAALWICLQTGASAAVLPHSCQRAESQGHVPAPYRSQLSSQMGGRHAIQSYLDCTFVAYFQVLSPRSWQVI